MLCSAYLPNICHRDFVLIYVAIGEKKDFQVKSGPILEQNGPFSGLFLDIGSDRDQVPKSGLKGKHWL